MNMFCVQNHREIALFAEWTDVSKVRVWCTDCHKNRNRTIQHFLIQGLINYFNAHMQIYVHTELIHTLLTDKHFGTMMTHFRVLNFYVQKSGNVFFASRLFLVGLIRFMLTLLKHPARRQWHEIWTLIISVKQLRQNKFFQQLFLCWFSSPLTARPWSLGRFLSP